MIKISEKIIIDGVTLALRNNFPDCQIHTEKVEQGLVEPAFIVRIITSNISPVNKNLSQKSPRLHITYIPANGLNECYEVQNKLFYVIEHITLPEGNSVRGTDINSEITDGLLHMSISYNHHLFSKSDETYMENAKVIQEG